MGRPPTRPVTLRDGFYIEVRSKGASSGIKIRQDDEALMNESANHYRRDNKDVLVLGEHRKGKWVNEADVKEKRRGRLAASAAANTGASKPSDNGKAVAPAKVAAKPEVKAPVKTQAKPVAKPAAKPEPKKVAKKPAAKAKVAKKPAPAKAKPKAKAKPAPAKKKR